MICEAIHTSWENDCNKSMTRKKTKTRPSHNANIVDFCQFLVESRSALCWLALVSSVWGFLCFSEPIPFILRKFVFDLGEYWLVLYFEEFLRKWSYFKI